MFSVDILIEAHAKFDVMNAIQLGKRLEEYRPLWYEEPVSEENLSELLEVRRKVDIPIATGERLYSKFPFARIVEAHAADVLQPDVANAGGITELKKIAAIAEAKHKSQLLGVLDHARQRRDMARNTVAFYEQRKLEVMDQIAFAEDEIRAVAAALDPQEGSGEKPISVHNRSRDLARRLPP